MDNNTKIEVINKRKSSYSAQIPNGEYYEWLPAEDGFEDVQLVTMRDVLYLRSATSTFRDGYLFINDADVRKRFGMETEKNKTITMSKEEISTMLGGNLTKIKKVVDENKENTSFVQEVVEVAKEMKLDNVSKLQYIAEVSGVPVEVITGQA